MNTIRLLYGFCIMLTFVGCIKQKENAQTPLDNTTLPDLTVQQSLTNDTSSKNDNKNVLPGFISIILNTEDTKDVTDITEFFIEYLKDKPDEYRLRVTDIVFKQDNTSEKKLEHLGSLKIFPNLKYLAVYSNLTSIDINGLPDSLESLFLSHNKITSFNAETLPKELGVIKLDNNNLLSFNVEIFPENLLWLDLSHNNLSFFDVSCLPQSLLNLKLSHNNISSFDIASLPERVDYLDLSYNPIPIKPISIGNKIVETLSEIYYSTTPESLKEDIIFD